MICPKCGEEDSRREVDMTYILDLLHGAICDRCRDYSFELAWRWANIPVAPFSQVLLNETGASTD